VNNRKKISAKSTVLNPKGRPNPALKNKRLARQRRALLLPLNIKEPGADTTLISILCRQLYAVSSDAAARILLFVCHLAAVDARFRH
jgi:hypothetical protein